MSTTTDDPTKLDPAKVIAETFGPPGDDTPPRTGTTPVKREALGNFESEDVLAARLRIRGAGTGLNGALDLAPILHRRGDTIHVLLELNVDKVYFEPLKDVDGAVARVHDCVTVAGTIIDDAKGSKLLASTKKAIAKAQEEAEGVQRIPGLDDDSEGGDS